MTLLCGGMVVEDFAASSSYDCWLLDVMITDDGDWSVWSGLKTKVTTGHSAMIPIMPFTDPHQSKPHC